ncbi:MAG: rRNA pseudouridine synthase [Prolixibacteraceae bacterium]|nr:rRNA pseudouridine synthase [Prolixibacteraceae bacterium]
MRKEIRGNRRGGRVQHDKGIEKKTVVRSGGARKSREEHSKPAKSDFSPTGERRQRRTASGNESVQHGRVYDKRSNKGSPTERKKLVKRNERRLSRREMLRELGLEHDWQKRGVRKPKAESDLMRLNRHIANSGVCSRREADTYIQAGVVSVNGQVVTELGAKVSSNDEVRFHGELINPEKKVYILLNKPKGYVTTTEDPHAVQTVMDLIRPACTQRVYPVGRLDKNTTGLLLFTNDGDLAKRLSHPSHNVEKIYQVTLDKNVPTSDVKKIASGVELEDGVVSADSISYVEGQDKNIIGIEIHSGKNRIVRRIFEHLGYRIKSLDRVSYAGLTKKNLPRGKWRFLAPKEVNFLKMR